MVGCLHRKQENIDQKSTYYVYYKYYKIISRKKFLQEHVFATLWPILENTSSGKSNRSGALSKQN